MPAHEARETQIADEIEDLVPHELVGEAQLVEPALIVVDDDVFECAAEPEPRFLQRLDLAFISNRTRRGDFLLVSVLTHEEIPVLRADERVLAVKDLVLYPGRYEVRVKGDLVELTKKEYSLLEYMLRNKPNVLTRDQILQEVWGYDYVGDTNVVDVYIRYLRAKIDERFDDKYIYTVRGRLCNQGLGGSGVHFPACAPRATCAYRRG